MDELFDHVRAKCPDKTLRYTLMHRPATVVKIIRDVYGTVDVHANRYKVRGILKFLEDEGAVIKPREKQVYSRYMQEMDTEYQQRCIDQVGTLAMEWPAIRAAFDKAMSTGDVENALVIGMYTLIPPARLDYIQTRVFIGESAPTHAEMDAVGSRNAVFVHASRDDVITIKKNAKKNFSAM